MTLENVSFLEGVRIVLSIVCFAALGWAFTHSRNGSMAFAAPIRGKMTNRRRWQIVGNIGIILAIGTQSTQAASVPDPAVISAAGSNVSYLLIWIESIILVKTLMFSIGWAGVEEIVGSTPLDPTAQERLAEATAAGRALGHIARGELQIISSTFEVVLQEPDLDPERRREIERALVSVETVVEQVKELHERVRALEPSPGEHAP